MYPWNFFLWDHWYSCFGLLVISPPGFKAREDSLIHTWERHTCYTIPKIHLWCNTCWPLCSQYGSWANFLHVLASRHWWDSKLGPIMQQMNALPTELCWLGYPWNVWMATIMDLSECALFFNPIIQHFHLWFVSSSVEPPNMGSKGLPVFPSPCLTLPSDFVVASVVLPCLSFHILSEYTIDSSSPSGGWINLRIHWKNYCHYILFLLPPWLHRF